MFILRILYFLLIGWWLGTLWSGIAYLLCISIIGLPLGLAMFNKLPQVLTLKPYNRGDILISEKDGQKEITIVKRRELPFIIRVIYFFVVGWELTGAWVSIALVLCCTIIGMPIGLSMLNHIPAVLTLKINY